MKQWIVTFGFKGMHWHLDADKIVMEPECNRITFEDEHGLAGCVRLNDIEYMFLMKVKDSPKLSPGPPAAG